MRLDINQIPVEGLVLIEEFDPKKFDIETDVVKFKSPLHVEVKARKTGNTIFADTKLSGVLDVQCGRCLKNITIDLKKNIELTYPLERGEKFVDLDPDIREEVIVDYPIKPLCSDNCKGLCLKCGRNLNEGGCTCGTT